jgi:EAL domain-containing protein (putative c-di-GMP-specific phosphodiesterase class I)
MKHIQNALDHMGRLRPAHLNLSAKRNFSLREAVLFMAPKLTEMKELGFTTRELTAALAEKEIIIKAPTLNRYLSEYQSDRSKKPESPDEISTASAVVSAVSEFGSTDRL